MEIVQLTFNSFSENTYLLIDKNKETIIVDPGMFGEDEEKDFIEIISKNKLKPTKIINTHCHIDHILGINFLKKTYKIKFYASKSDEYLLETAVQVGEMYGFDIKEAPKIDKYISEKDEIKFGSSKINIFKVPGHTTGHLAFYSVQDKFIITGDVLFKDSIGRTDLPGGDLDILLESINHKIMSLPDDFIVYPGHGIDTTIGTEKRNNPFL